jgi:hypothetical protein
MIGKTRIEGNDDEAGATRRDDGSVLREASTREMTPDREPRGRPRPLKGTPLKINISYSQKANRSNGVQPWASASIEREFPEELFAKPSLLFAEMRQTYAIAEAAVAEQLENVGLDDEGGPGDVRGGDPVRDRMRQAPPVSTRSFAAAPSSSPLPSPAASASAPSASPSPSPSPSNQNGSKDGPPTTARELAGWAKRRGLIKWFTELGRKQDPPLPGLLFEWSNEWAVWAYQAWLASQSAATAAPTNGNDRN